MPAAGAMPYPGVGVYYIIGDIHGHYIRLLDLYKKLEGVMTGRDRLLFLGDYIDRGAHSYEVIDFLVYLSRMKRVNAVFLKGNHEDMFMKYLRGEDREGIYMMNGGDATLRSYRSHRGSLEMPTHHRDFFNSLRLYHEEEDFIAVHAGLNPKIERIEAQDERDMLWIRDEFFRADRRWGKTIIFGHTPVSYIRKGHPIYFDEERNIIGIDSGVIFGNPIICLTWPGKRIISG